MVQNGPFRVSHMQEIDAKALELPYKGNKLSLIIVRPNQIDGLRNIEKRLVQFFYKETSNKGWFSFSTKKHRKRMVQFLLVGV